MNYLINIFFIFFININIVFAKENIKERILFKIDNKAFTSIDLEVRRNYLKLLNEEIIYEDKNFFKDYISVLIFAKYYSISGQNINELNSTISDLNNKIDKLNKTNYDLSNKLEDLQDNDLNLENTKYKQFISKIKESLLEFEN